jgi:hypothetical protein
LLAPPLVPFALVSTTNPGRSLPSLPNPYSVHDPKLGRPNCCDPVFIRIWAGAWFTASVCNDRTRQMSSAILAVCGNSSLSSIPQAPCLANLNFGPSSADFGLMNAAR